MITDKGIIDVHSHFSVHGAGAQMPAADKSAEHLLKINNAAGITAAFCSTYEIAENRESCTSANLECLSKTDIQQIFAWICVNPSERGSFHEAEKLLKNKKTVGIKALPISHGYGFAEYADEILGFCKEINAVCQIQLEGDVSYIGDIANRHKYTKIILGANHRHGYTEAIKNSKFDNLFIDTAGGAQINNLIIERLYTYAGDNKILFGTEGLASPAFMRGRIEYARIPEHAKDNIFRNNALNLFADRLEGMDI